MPVFHPNLYVLTELRQTNVSATIERALREISVLLDYLVDIGVDLNKRMREGWLFFPGEIDGLARYCRNQISRCRCFNVHCSAKDKRNTVSNSFARNGCQSSFTIHAYLSWLIVLRMSSYRAIRCSVMLAQVKENVLPTLKARILQRKKYTRTSSRSPPRDS